MQDKTMNKSDKVRELLGLGAPPAEIAKQVGCTLGLIYTIRSKMAGKKAGRGPGRPRRSASTADGSAAFDYTSFVDSVRGTQKETEKLRSTLEHVAELIRSVL